VTDFAAIDDRQPWEKQPGETIKAFEAFVLYRDYDHGRSLMKVARDLHEAYPERFASVDSARAVLGGWSVRHDWQRRVEQYDVWRDRRYLEQRQSEREQLKRQHAQIGGTLIAAGVARLSGRAASEQAKAIDPLDLNHASVSDTLSLIERGTRLQRITAGLPTDLTRRYTESDLMRLAEWARESAYEVACRGRRRRRGTPWPSRRAGAAKGHGRQGRRRRSQQ
jgi:hypothetical protein